MNNLDRFGKVISEDLRDNALNHYLDIESEFLQSPRAKELSAKLSSFSSEQKAVIRELLTECIDSGIHDFLQAIEEEKEGISVNINGQNIAPESDGLNGEIFTEDGWFEKYSQHKETGI